ncbi:MAG TPA: alpha/beta hydrolase [Candidatus Dormibacteraeota bacterium]|nr:alpha/beta hydrolase [Candidatus Dormibacteraeota bacterium]
MLVAAVLALATVAHAPAMGAYRLPGRVVYVGIDAEPPDQPTIQFYDSKTRRMGTLDYVCGRVYRTDARPALTFTLGAPAIPVRERPLIVGTAAGRLGASLWYAPNAAHRATIALIQGADDSTRQMGFLIPYFIAHGLTVVTYDQRGTGDSVGDWRYASPASKAEDILALLRVVRSDPAVDSRRIGAWAASNGGWVAPIVATRFPLAFLILKSTSSESITDNVLYEIAAELREYGRFTSEQISQAMLFERTMFDALATDSNWNAAALALTSVKTQPWFRYMRIPPGFTVPPAAALLAALRASLIYDPAATLDRVRTPTLALFGALDKNVDASDSAARYRNAFKQSGMTDFTIITFAHAGHLLVDSRTGYEDQSSLPVHYLGYPEAMLHWLEARGFAT